jgi:hypothetical protein
MAEALLNPDEKENPDELLAEIEKVLHAAGNTEADNRIDSMSKEQLKEILQIARMLSKQQQKKRKKKKVETEEEQDDNDITAAKGQQQEREEEEEITVQ